LSAVLLSKSFIYETAYAVGVNEGDATVTTHRQRMTDLIGRMEMVSATDHAYSDHGLVCAREDGRPLRLDLVSNRFASPPRRGCHSSRCTGSATAQRHQAVDAVPAQGQHHRQIEDHLGRVVDSVWLLAALPIAPVWPQTRT
jgi:hypothetical protein